MRHPARDLRVVQPSEALDRLPDLLWWDHDHSGQVRLGARLLRRHLLPLPDAISRPEQAFPRPLECKTPNIPGGYLWI